jgi:hypothetical protein
MLLVMLVLALPIILKWVALFVFAACIIVLLLTCKKWPVFKITLAIFLMACSVLLYMKGPKRTDYISDDAWYQSARHEKALALCQQEQRAQSAAPIAVRGLTLEDNELDVQETVRLLTDKKLEFLEIKVFSKWERNMLTRSNNTFSAWMVKQQPGQYVRVQLAAEGTPGCLVGKELSGYYSLKDLREKPEFLERERAAGQRLCLWLGAIDAPTAPVRLDYEANPQAKPKDPKGKYRLVDTQTQTVLAYRTVADRGVIDDHCPAPQQLTKLLTSVVQPEAQSTKAKTLENLLPGAVQAPAQ